MSIKSTPKHVNVINPNGNFLVVVPHSGRNIPTDSLDNIILTPNYSSGYDMYSLELFEGLKDLNATVIASYIHRYIVDLNRARNDTSDAGVIRAVDFNEEPILKQQYSTDERERLLLEYYDPFHNTLEEYANTLREQHGKIFILAGHTMNSKGPKLAPDAGKTRPDFCVGTLDDTLADVEYIKIFEEAIREGAAPIGYKVEKNHPYRADDYITVKFGRPKEGYHTIQLEVNQAICRDAKERQRVSEIIKDAAQKVTA